MLRSNSANAPVIRNIGLRWRSRPSLLSCIWERRSALYAAVNAASAPEYQPGRVLIDVFDRLVQLGKRTAAIDGEGRELLEAGIRKAREPGGDLVRTPVEIFRKLANRVRRLGRSHHGCRRCR